MNEANMQLSEYYPDIESPVAVTYQQYAPALFAYLCRQMTSREDAEDLLLEIFQILLEQEKFWSLGDKEQRAWLWRVAHNKVIDHYRRFVRKPSVPLKQVAEQIFLSDDLSPEQVVLKHEEYTHLYAALQNLPAHQREVLQLRFGHGLSCAEIAPVMNKSEGAIRMLLSRTLRLLRTIYKQQ